MGFLLLAVFAAFVKADNCTCTIHAEGGLLTCQPTTCSVVDEVELFQSNATTIDFSNLEKVNANFRVLSSPHIRQILAPNLVSIAGRFSIETAPVLDQIDFTSLSTVSGTTIKVLATGLTEIKFPKLVNVPDFIVAENTKLLTASFGLETTGFVNISFNNALENLDFPKLSTFQGLLIYQCKALVNVELSTISEVDSVQVSTSSGKPGAQDITIATATLETLSMPELTNINYRLIIASNSLTSLVMPKLESTGEFTITSRSLLAINFPVLRRVDRLSFSALTVANVEFPSLTMGDVGFQQNTGLVSISLPLWVNGSLDVEQNAALRTLAGSFPKWNSTDYLPEQKVGNVRVIANNNLRSLAFEALLETNSIAIANNPNLQTVGIDVLTSVTSISIAGNQNLQNISFTELELIDSVTLTGLTSAEEVHVGAPNRVLSVTNNSVLFHAELPALKKLKDLTIASLLELESVNLKGLLNVTRLTVQGNSALESLSFPLLKEVSALTFNNNKGLRKIDSASFPVLGRLESLVITLNNNLVSAVLAGPTRITEVTVQNNLNLVEFNLTNALRLDDLIVQLNPNIAVLGAPKLVNCTYLTVVGNSFVTIDLSSLHTVNALKLDYSKKFEDPEVMVKSATPSTVLLDSLDTVSSFYFGMNCISKLTLTNLRSVTNFVVEAATALEGLILPSLARANDFSVLMHGLPAALKYVDLPALTFVNVNLTVTQSNTIETLDVPVLTEIRGSLNLGYNPLLAVVSFPKLTKIWGDLSLRAGLTGLRTIDFSAATDINRLMVAGDRGWESRGAGQAPGLVNLTLPLLNNVSGIEITYDKNFYSISAPALTKISSDQGAPAFFHVLQSEVRVLKFGSLALVSCPISVTSNLYLTTFELPALVTAKKSISIRFNDKLISLNFTSLKTVGEFLEITDNYGLVGVGLSTLETVSQNLVIAANPALTFIGLKSLRNVGTFKSVGLRIADLVNGTTSTPEKYGCVDLDCLDFAVIFDVFWCGRRNTTAVKCDQGGHWNCKCPHAW